MIWIVYVMSYLFVAFITVLLANVKFYSKMNKNSKDYDEDNRAVLIALAFFFPVSIPIYIFYYLFVKSPMKIIDVINEKRAMQLKAKEEKAIKDKEETLKRESLETKERLEKEKEEEMRLKRETPREVRREPKSKGFRGAPHRSWETLNE